MADPAAVSEARGIPSGALPGGDQRWRGSDAVKQQSGANIPDVWQASGSLVNVAGALRGAADTLKFSLVWKSNGAP
jgi:hypothetical protein